MPPIDDDILASMTDEEREALKELEEQEAAASDDDPEVDLGAKPNDQAQEGGEEAAAAAAAPAADPAEGGAADDAGNGGSEEGAQPEIAQQAPLLVAEAPADAEAQLQQIAEQKAALVEKFDDGDLTAKEYQQQLDALSRQERTIERALDKAQIAADLEMQRQVNEREKTINSFLSEVGIPRDPGNLRFVTLDGAVRLIANQEENSNLGPREILQKAFDLCVEQGTLQAKTPAKPQQEQRPARKPIDAPVTLANVPAADISDTDNARWAHISRIKDPDARERAFAQLSPAEQDAYLASGA